MTSRATRKKGFADASTAVGRERRAGAKTPGPVPALSIIAHPNAERAGERLLLDALVAGKEVALSRNAPDFTLPGLVLGEPLADPFLSRKPIRLSPTAGGGVRLGVDEGGTAVVVGERVRGPLEIGPEDLEHGVPVELAARVVLLLHLVDPAVEDGPDALGMVGHGAGIRRVRKTIERIVDLSVPVLIRGETGTGKELVARGIHARSPRRDGPFVSVNLGAIPRDLAAAELFGAQRGAYSGATRDRTGFFEAARGGTLFLDEVGEAPPEVQVMLLRVLETGEMYPVGGHAPVMTDVRLIAATDADLEESIRDGRFKAPLLHRLAGYEVRLPPLRERREDIGVLFYHFAREELSVIGEAHRLAHEDPYAEPYLPAPIAARLCRHAWPGNIRQLRNVARQLVIGSRGQGQLQIDARLAAELDAEADPLPARAAPAVTRKAGAPSPRRKPAEVTEAELLAALREHAWDLQAAADRLRIPRPSIYDLIEKSSSIRTAGDLGAEEIERCYRECGGDLDSMGARLQVSRRALGRRLREMGLGGR
jgi:two-component system nitrogen regulation response regulator GlnG